MRQRQEKRKQEDTKIEGELIGENKDEKRGDGRIQRQEGWRQENTKIGGVEIGEYEDGEEIAQGEPENSGKVDIKATLMCISS